MTNKIQVTTIFSRRSESDKFYQMTREEIAYVNDKYIETGKIISRNSYLASDKMSKTVVTHFANQDVLDEFNSDPIQIKVIFDRNKLCKENNIQISLIKQEYNDDGIVNSNKSTIEL